MFRRRNIEPATTPSQHRTPSGWHRDEWQSYDSVAAEYEQRNVPRHEPAARDLVELTGIEPGQRVLDVGTGTGVAAAAALEATGPGGLVVGVDPSAPMLSLARVRATGARFVVGQALDLPFRDWRFDAVIANFVLSHFTRYETGLHDMLRVLRDGGRLGVTNWAGSEDEFGRAWREVAEGLVGRELYNDSVLRAIPWQQHFSDPVRLEEALERAGLRGVEVHDRRYRFEMTLEEYIAGQESRIVSRSLQRIMGDAIWERFRAQIREEFHRRFRDPIGDTRAVWIAVGRKA